MKRRDLLKALASTGASAAALQCSSARAQSADDEEFLGEDVDPYFLDSGEMTADEHDAQVRIEELQREMMNGRPVAIPRGLRSARAPTYRLVHWTGAIGDPDGRFLSPLSVEPALGTLVPQQAYRVNGQILGFRGADDDWGGKTNQGTLTVELRARNVGEQMTWFFAQQFEMDEQGFTNLGFEYIAQRDGAPEAVTTDEPNVSMRIQLMRAPRRSGMALRKIIKTALVVTGVPLDLKNQDLQSTLQYLPPVRAPAMLQEGAALAQAVVGGTAEEIPIWRGGFSSYGVAEGGSQLSIRPGLWMAIDAARETDLRDVQLEDLGGVVCPTRDGEPLDANFLVMSFEIQEGQPPEYFNFGRGVEGNDTLPRAVPRGVDRSEG